MAAVSDTSERCVEWQIGWSVVFPPPITKRDPLQARNIGEIVRGGEVLWYTPTRRPMSRPFGLCKGFFNELYFAL